MRNMALSALQAPRVYLHAALLGFVHPETENRTVLFERKPSPEFYSGLRAKKAGRSLALF
jgi:hypothetical protein